MEQIILEGIITATSKKGTQFDGSPAVRKTVYFELDKDNTEKAQAFGLTEYTSKEDGKNFFITVATETVDLYDKYGAVIGEADGGTETPNWHTDDKKVNLAILKGESKGNTFYRLKGIQGEVQEVEAQNLFAETSADLQY